MIKNNNNIANHKLKCYCIFLLKNSKIFFIFLNEKKNSKIRLVQIGK